MSKSTLVAIKIDVTKIDENRYYIGKNGAKYLDATVFINDEEGQYGDHGMITQSVSKEEREAGVKIILGNVKKLGEFGNNSSPAPAPAPVASVAEDDIPF